MDPPHNSTHPTSTDKMRVSLLCSLATTAILATVLLLQIHTSSQVQMSLVAPRGRIPTTRCSTDMANNREYPVSRIPRREMMKNTLAGIAAGFVVANQAKADTFDDFGSLVYNDTVNKAGPRMVQKSKTKPGTVTIR
mmetsp:Transcript_9173/g.22533  ORF Transcript_9173/g.22533 Transcript_9173/m.22533 type:complete len:137 (+) Transcript_9173:146-556(+)